MSAAPARPPLWLLVMVTISGTMAMHMFVPSLPAAAGDLGASLGQMQMAISLYIIGLALGQLAYGPLSDAWGRRPVLMAGLALYAAGGLAAALAPSLHVLLGARLAQALGGCAGLALGRAIVRDSSRADDTVRRMALMNLMMMIGPGLSPVVGGALSGAAGWRPVFWLLAGLGLLTLLLTWKLLPETARPSGRLTARGVAGDYRALLGSRVFVGFAIGGGCATTAIYAFIATAPFIFATELGRPLHEVGLYMGVMIFGLSIGNALTGRLIGRLSIERLMVGGNVVSCVGAAGLLLMVLAGHLSVAGVLSWMMVFTCGAGMTSPAALTKAVRVQPQLTGSASGLYGFTQMAAGAVFTTLVSFGSDPARSAATVLLGASLLAQAAFWTALRAERRLAM